MGLALNKSIIGLIMISILLITAILCAVYFYSNYSTIATEKEQLKQQVNDLTNEIEELNAPRLATSLEAEDKEAYLQITGEVWNMGHETAYYCKLYVILYEGDNIAKEDYVHIGDNIGMIAEQRYDRVDAKVYYEGAHITDWEITPVVGEF